MIDFDGAWKYAIERVFRWMIECLCPDLAAEIDWSIPPEFMDQELPNLAGRRKRGGRIVDKLIKVRLLRGGDRYLLIHVEAQNKRDHGFSERVYTIFYRLWDKYHVKADITCLAILTDLNPNWRPNVYEHSGYGVRLRFDYPCIKLMDLEAQLKRMETRNPFAMIACIHLDLMRRRTDIDPFEWKRDLFLRALRLEGKFSTRDAATILAFIDWLMRLPSELDNHLKESINESMKEAGMEWSGGIHGNIRILALQEGRQEGLEAGRKEMLTHLLKVKFGEVPEIFIEKIEKASSEMITDWFDKALVAKEPGELLRH